MERANNYYVSSDISSGSHERFIFSINIITYEHLTKTTGSVGQEVQLKLPGPILNKKETINLLCPFYVQDEMIIAKSLNTLNGSRSIFTMNKVDKCKALWMKEKLRLKSNHPMTTLCRTISPISLIIRTADT